MAKITLEEAASSSTPYLDVFGEESRSKGRPAGSAQNYDTSLALPSGEIVPDRREAARIREKVRRRAMAVLTAVSAEDLKRIYRAELVLELSRIGIKDDAGTTPAATGQTRPDPISVEQARQLPGSGFLPGETYWDWMKTFNDKPDDQWATEKVQVKKNISKLVRGTHHGD